MAYTHLDQENNYDSASYYANLLRLELITNEELADHAILLGKINFMKNDYAGAILSYKQALAYDSTSYLAPYAYIGLARSHNKFRNLSQALTFYQNALILFEESGEDFSIAQTKKMVALLYQDLFDYEKALEMYNELIDYFPEGSEDLASVYNNIGALHYKQANYKIALKFHKKALALISGTKVKATQGLYLHNVGDVYLQLGAYDSAAQFLRKAFNIHKELNDRRNIAKVSLLLSRLYLGSSKHSEIPELLKEAERLAKEVKERALLIDIYRGWVQYLEANGQYREANNYYSLVIATKDTLLNEEKVRAISDLEIKYETERKEKALNASLAREKVQQQSIALQRATIVGLILITILVVTVGILIYRLYSTIKREKEQVILRMREQHHRIENNISVLASILSLAAKNSSNEEARTIAKDGENRLNAMNLLHKDLYWDDKKITIQFNDYVENLGHYLSGIFSDPGKNKVTIKTELQVLNLDVNQAIPLSLVLNELLTNAFKYGIKNKQPVIKVELLKNQGSLSMTVTDNGSGIKESTGSKKSFGMSLVATLVQQLRGELITNSDGLGTSVRIVAPMK